MSKYDLLLEYQKSINELLNKRIEMVGKFSEKNISKTQFNRLRILTNILLKEIEQDFKTSCRITKENWM